MPRRPLPFTHRAFFVLPAAAVLALSAGCGDSSSSSSGSSGSAGTAGTAGASGSAGDAGTAGSSGAGATAGSGGTGGAAGTAGSGGSEFVMAPHHPFPVMEGTPGAVIKNGKLVSVVFGGNPDADKIFQSGDALVASKWLIDVGGEYGIGAGQHLAKVTLPEMAPANLTETAMLNLIDQHIKDGMIPMPTPDTMYMIYISKQTTYKDDGGIPMCDMDVGYLGYHYQTNIPSGTITYAVVGDCDIGFTEVTATFAHEYIEMATDPGDTGGYYIQVGPTDPWYTLLYSECADLCDYSDYVVEGGFSFQKSWSNKAAAAAVTSPCAPVDPAEVYYNVSAEPNNVVGVAAGQSTMFTLTGWSTAPTADWDLHFDTAYYGDFDPGVQFSDMMINNAKTVTVTITVPAGTPKGQFGTAMIYSGPDYGRYWPVTVKVM